eukprot:30355-Pelagococcus_subviridis.AAC.4
MPDPKFARVALRRGSPSASGVRLLDIGVNEDVVEFSRHIGAPTDRDGAAFAPTVRVLRLVAHRELNNASRRTRTSWLFLFHSVAPRWRPPSPTTTTTSSRRSSRASSRATRSSRRSTRSRS